MKRMLITLAAGLVMVFGCASLAETIDTHKTFRPQEIKWGPGPAGLPAGAEFDRSLWRPQKHGHVRVAGQNAEGIQHRSAYACRAGNRYSHQW